VTFEVTFEVTPIRGVSQGPGLFGQVQTPGGLLTPYVLGHNNVATYDITFEIKKQVIIKVCNCFLILKSKKQFLLPIF
jgi:hypothetical protein